MCDSGRIDRNGSLVRARPVALAGPDVGDDVAVRQHHALRAAPKCRTCSRSLPAHRRRAPRSAARGPVAGRQRSYRRQRVARDRDAGRTSGVAHAAVRADRLGCARAFDDQRPGLGIAGAPRDVLRIVIDVERNDDEPQSERGEVERDPIDAVAQADRDAVARLEAQRAATPPASARAASQARRRGRRDQRPSRMAAIKRLVRGRRDAARRIPRCSPLASSHRAIDRCLPILPPLSRRVQSERGAKRARFGYTRGSRAESFDAHDCASSAATSLTTKKAKAAAQKSSRTRPRATSSPARGTATRSRSSARAYRADARRQERSPSRRAAVVPDDAAQGFDRAGDPPGARPLARRQDLTPPQASSANGASSPPKIAPHDRGFPRVDDGQELACAVHAAKRQQAALEEFLQRGETGDPRRPAHRRERGAQQRHVHVAIERGAELDDQRDLPLAFAGGCRTHDKRRNTKRPTAANLRRAWRPARGRARATAPRARSPLRRSTMTPSGSTRTMIGTTRARSASRRLKSPGP